MDGQSNLVKHIIHPIVFRISDLSSRLDHYFNAHRAQISSYSYNQIHVLPLIAYIFYCFSIRYHRISHNETVRVGDL